MIEKYLLIPADINSSPRWINCDSHHLLRDMKFEMHCEYVECVCRRISCFGISGTLVFIVDEFGKICNPPKPFNLYSTGLYSNSCDFLVGDVVLGWIGSRDGETDIVPLPPLIAHHILNLVS